MKTKLSILCLSAFLAAAPFLAAQTQGDNSPGGASSATDRTTNPAAGRDGVTIYKEHVYVIKNGVASQVTERTEMAGGIVVDKATIMRDGTTVIVPEGQMITADGTIIDLPPNAINPPVSAGSHGSGTTQP